MSTPTQKPRRTHVKGYRGVYWRPVTVEYRDKRGTPRTKTERAYEITYIDSDGRRRWKTVPGGLDDAVAAREDLSGRMRRGERVAPNRKTLAEVAAEWMATQTELRPGTIERYQGALDVHILPRLGHLKVGEITHGDVAWLLADMKTGAYYARDENGHRVRKMRKTPAAGATLQATLRPLSRILEDCDGIAGNPVSQLKKGQRPKASKRAKRVLDEQELERLLDHARPLYRPLLATAAFTGLRQSELLGLLWLEVDFDAGYIHVCEQLGRDGRRVPPKTEQAVRDVALAPKLATMLRAHRLASARSGDDDFVFVNEAGHPFNHRNVQSRGFDYAAKAAGLDEGKRRKATFHDLRRTFGSMLIAKTRDIAHVARQMGHANPSITLSIYTDEINATANAEQTRSTLDAAIGTSLETAGGERGRNDEAAEAATVTAIGSASGMELPAASGGELAG